jgi:hypothetical protein
MSSHYLYIQCENCDKTESIYTGDLTTYGFDDDDWEMSFIPVKKCTECKEKENKDMKFTTQPTTQADIDISVAKNINPLLAQQVGK